MTEPGQEEAAQFSGKMERARSAPDELKAALQVQLRRILDQPITARTLRELEETAHLSRQMLIVAGDPGARRRRRRQRLGLAMGDDYEDYGMDEPEMDGGVIGPENFGAAAIREIVAAQKQPSLTREVEALAAAKEAGLTKVAERLEKNIMERLDESTPVQVKLDRDIDTLRAEDRLRREDRDGGAAPLDAEERAILDQAIADGDVEPIPEGADIVDLAEAVRDDLEGGDVA